jgi:hypothetical protein
LPIPGVLSIEDSLNTKCGLKKENTMKKFTLAIGLAVGLGVSNYAMADGWDYAKSNSRNGGGTEKSAAAADVSSQNAKAAVLSANAKQSKAIGKTTVVYSDRGGEVRSAEITVTK